MEVPGLELGDNVDGEFSLLSESRRLSAIVRTMAEFLAHETVSIMSIVRGVCDFDILVKDACPRKVRPTYSRNSGMRVSRFTDVEVSSIME